MFKKIMCALLASYLTISTNCCFKDNNSSLALGEMSIENTLGEYNRDNEVQTEWVQAVTRDDVDALRRIISENEVAGVNLIEKSFVFDRADLRALGLPVYSLVDSQILTLFTLAIESGSRECFRYLLDKGANDFNFFRHEGQFDPAECAAISGQMEILQELERIGNPYFYYKKLLLFALDGMRSSVERSAESCAEIARWLITERHLNLARYGHAIALKTAEHIAFLSRGEFDKIKDVIDRNWMMWQVDHAADNLGIFLSELVHSGGNNDVIMFFADRFPDILDWRDDSGRTLLHTACEIKNLDLIRYFIRLGMDVNTQAFDGMSPLACAMNRFGTLYSAHEANQCACILRENGARNSSLRRSRRRARQDVVRDLRRRNRLPDVVFLDLQDIDNEEDFCM